MTSLIRLDVHREKTGVYELVGYLEDTDSGTLFRYDDDYLRLPHARAVSSSLPLRQAAFAQRETRSYFEALILEGELRKAFERSEKIADGSYIASLAQLNDETEGALVFDQGGVLPGVDERYESVQDDFFDDFSIMPASMALKASKGIRLSLAGTMAKLGLYLDPATHRWFYPLGSAPSSHIIKAPSDSFPGQVFNEALCMRTARLLGLDAASTDLMRCPSTERVLLVSRRFDRPYSDDLKISGMRRPLRLHQEDFCQLLGYMSTEKYDEDGKHDLYLGAAASSMLLTSENAASDRFRLYEMVVFNTLIGNCDAHLKNYALLYDESWDYTRVAPLYDVVSTTVWDHLSTTLGLSFSGKSDLSAIERADFRELARLLGMSKTHCDRAEERAADMAAKLSGAIETVRDEITREGFPEVGHTADRILQQTHDRTSRLFGV